MSRRANKEAYLTSEYDSWAFRKQSYGLAPPEQALVSRLLPRHSTILEVGCGGGRVAAGLERMGYTRVVGLDYVFGFTQAARSLISRVITGDATRLPMATASLE